MEDGPLPSVAHVTAPITRAVLLAAGRGKRLGDLTAHRPKPLIPVQGKPLLQWIIEGLRDAGIAEFLCVIGYLGEAIRDRFGDGSELGVGMQYAWQLDVHGTGAALRLGHEFAEGGPALMSFGDILTDHRHYGRLPASFDAHPCAAVMGINPMDDVSAGAAVIRAGDRVTAIVEKPGPSDPTSRWNQAGVTAFGAEIWPVLERLPKSARGEYELTSAIAMLISEGREVRAVEFDGFWSDVGTPEALAHAEREWQPTSRGVL
ncbi:MAG: nucleotidyltransferase family protein [Armatimonadetes bacterium]|nr:nucleotidyltransferase family protein [Armatimonadota bacterium]